MNKQKPQTIHPFLPSPPTSCFCNINLFSVSVRLFFIIYLNSFTQHNALKFHPCCCQWQYIIFYGQVILSVYIYLCIFYTDVYRSIYIYNLYLIYLIFTYITMYLTLMYVIYTSYFLFSLFIYPLMGIYVVSIFWLL